MKILLVDDNHYACDALYEFLEMLPYECDYTYSGKEAAVLLQKKSYDILISDLNMPEVGGEALLELITQEKLSTRVLMISGDDGLERAFSLLGKGAASFFKKPIDVFRLSDFLKDFVRYGESEAAQEALLEKWERDGVIKQQDFCPEKLAFLLGEGPQRPALFTGAQIHVLRSAAHILRELNKPLLFSGLPGAGKTTMAQLLSLFLKDVDSTREISCNDITATLLCDLESLPSSTLLIFARVQECPKDMWKSWISWLEKEYTLSYSSRGEKKLPPVFTVDHEDAQTGISPEFFLRLAPHTLVMPLLKAEDRSLFFALLYALYLRDGTKETLLTLEKYGAWTQTSKIWTYGEIETLVGQEH